MKNKKPIFDLAEYNGPECDITYLFEQLEHEFPQDESGWPENTLGLCEQDLNERG